MWDGGVYIINRRLLPVFVFSVVSETCSGLALCVSVTQSRTAVRTWNYFWPVNPLRSALFFSSGSHFLSLKLSCLFILFSFFFHSHTFSCLIFLFQSAHTLLLWFFFFFFHFPSQFHLLTCFNFILFYFFHLINFYFYLLWTFSLRFFSFTTQLPKSTFNIFKAAVEFAFQLTADDVITDCTAADQSAATLHLHF